MVSLQRLRQRLLQDPRFARVVRGGLSGLIGRALVLLVNAITLPLTVHFLGYLQYGVWITISTSVTMLSVLDLGIASTLTTFVAEAYAEDDQAKAQHAYATAFWITLAIVILLAPVLFVVWRWINWGALFRLSDPALIQQAANSAAVAGVFFLFTLPLTLANRVLSGYQEVHLVNYFSMAGSVLGLLAVLVAMLLHGTMTTLMLAYSAALLLANLGLNLWLCFHQRPWVKPLPAKVAPKMIRKLFGQGFLFFILQMTGLVVFNSDNLVITHFLGASSVTSYSVAWRLTQYAALLQSFIVPSLWPAFTEAYHKQQLSWINQTYRAVRGKTLLVVGGAALAIALVGRPVIRIWVGSAAVPRSGLLWLMAAFTFVMAVTTNQATLLTATGRLRVEAAAAVAAALVNLALSIFLVQRIGAEGVMLASLLSFLVCMLVPQAWEVKRTLAGRYLPLSRLDKVPVA